NPGGGSVRRLPDVEIRSLGPGVVKIEQQGWANLLLNVKIANLHIAQPVIWIHRIIIGDTGDWRESALQRQGWRRRISRLNIRRRGSERRLQCKLLRD